ncbi:MAG: YaaR family protein [Defluviitaleaceae bacterium]|nr:YaaR family protein [Defluviitaleaceae bacterium]
MDVRVTEIINKTIGQAQKKQEAPKHEEFSFTLNRLGAEGLKERLSKLIGDITAQSERINKHMSINDLKHYRTLISSFINEIVTNGHEFSRENFLDRRGRHRVYGIVRKINEDLDTLAEELLSSEKNALSILDKTGQIQGLLMDLLI